MSLSPCPQSMHVFFYPLPCFLQKKKKTVVVALTVQPIARSLSLALLERVTKYSTAELLSEVMSTNGIFKPPLLCFFFLVYAFLD